MKKIVLIGDSIRAGYDKYVKQTLEGEVEVLYSKDSGRFAQYVLRTVSEWKKEEGWGDDIDLVHWNAGLWDVLRMFGDDRLTPPEMYGEMIRRVDKRLRYLFPNAKMVFATSTRVLEERYGKNFTRYNCEIEEYNAIALDALRDTDTVINDLYALTKELPATFYSDMTHLYTPEGTEVVTNQVLSVVCETLGLEKKVYNSGEYYSDKPHGV